MQLAFYAPLKSPYHQNPSGDRAMARSILKALETLEAEVTLASSLRSRDGAGAPARQTALIASAEQEMPHLIRQGKAEGWQAWITYHNYYKAPDLLGPAVTKALGIPYLQIESTRARKRLTGPWARFAQAAEDAADVADAILYFTHHDAEALTRDAPKDQHVLPLAPFLPQADLPPLGPRDGPMLAVGMMRPGDKVASYQLVAQTLHLLPVGTWQLDIAGDGAARDAVAALMAPFGDAVRFLGTKAPEEMSTLYQDASLLFWPGVNEAFGLSYLEAQAHGLPAVAQDRPGVRDVLAPGTYPDIDSGPQGLADMILPLLQDADQRRRSGDAARASVARTHLLPAAAARLRAALATVGVAP